MLQILSSLLTGPQSPGERRAAEPGASVPVQPGCPGREGPAPELLPTNPAPEMIAARLLECIACCGGYTSLGQSLQKLTVLTAFGTCENIGDSLCTVILKRERNWDLRGDPDLMPTPGAFCYEFTLMHQNALDFHSGKDAKTGNILK